MKIAIKNKANGQTIFTHNCKNNTIKLTVEAAITLDVPLNYANLSCADLSHASLSGISLNFVDLSYANLYCANLPYSRLINADLHCAKLDNANLSWTNLHNANLSNASLTWANFSNANLTNTNLTDANLYNATGDNSVIKTIQTGVYVINYTKDIVQIGCKKYPINVWLNFSDAEIHALGGQQALDFCHKWKPILKQIIEA